MYGHNHDPNFATTLSACRTPLHWDCKLITKWCRGSFFFFNDAAPPDIYTLPLPAALPISIRAQEDARRSGDLAAQAAAEAGFADLEAARRAQRDTPWRAAADQGIREHEASSRAVAERSEEHTSELQSRLQLACRPPPAKKK